MLILSTWKFSAADTVLLPVSCFIHELLASDWFPSQILSVCDDPQSESHRALFRRLSGSCIDFPLKPAPFIRSGENRFVHRIICPSLFLSSSRIRATHESNDASLRPAAFSHEILPDSNSCLVVRPEPSYRPLNCSLFFSNADACWIQWSSCRSLTPDQPLVLVLPFSVDACILISLSFPSFFLPGTPLPSLLLYDWRPSSC